nr:hypothetical protein [Desulfobacterales bacterium]
MVTKKILRRIRDRFREEQPKLLVVGWPRTGFTLLISILNNLIGEKRFRRDPLRDKLRDFIPQASEDVYKTIEEYFRNRINMDDLVISPEFKLLVGGPKWLSKENRDMACVRKYIGIKGMGDFLAVFSVPKFVMDFDNVVHSHYDPGLWLEDPYYREYLKFSSIRNPLDTINSAVFSINALAGEYINRFVNQDTNIIRDKLALPKLTDLNFIEGLISPFLDYLKAFVEVKDQYFVMRWEDLITEPEKTIHTIAKNAGISIPERVPNRIWDKMKYKDQTRYHKHNFRKGIIGDWKNHLVNEHLEILKGHGFDEFLQEFGYGKIEYLDKRDYTPYQKKVEEYITKGEIYNEIDDQDLFTFAFQKSNFRSSKYDFLTLKGKGSVEIERSSIKDEALLKGFVDVTEKALQPINESLKTIYARYVS